MLRIAALVIASAALLGACDSDDPAPIDAAAVTVDGDMTTDGGSVCGGTTAYLGTCAMDNECVSCTCRSFGHSSICSQTCTGDGDCPAPSGGCSSGFCRP